MTHETLTKQELLFCELYANGDIPYVGSMSRSYIAAFGETANAGNKAKKLLKREDIQAYLNELYDGAFEEVRYKKEFIASNLMHIAEECASIDIYDKRGRRISPAAARSVAVNALKALMDIYPVKEAQVNKLNIEGAGEGGITFNVIVPDKPKEESKE